MIQKFRDYQIEWLTSHCDIELEPDLEELIVRFLKDTAECFEQENTAEMVKPITESSQNVPNNDLISRKAAIEALKEVFNPSITNFVKAKIAIDKLPSAQQEQRWIPCSERMPEDNVEVFVYLERSDPYFAWVEDSRWYTEEFEVEKENYPTERAHLPEPAKLEND